MYLAELRIEGFRKLKSLDVRFQSGLNILVGPNNVGKTAVIDGLRALLTGYDDGGVRIDTYDLHVDDKKSKSLYVEFHYVFRGLTPNEEADFFAALKPQAGVAAGKGPYEAHLSVRFTPSEGTRMRPKRWCGDHEENIVTADMMEDLRAVYLPPLRDAASGLKPGRSSQLAKLVDRLADEVSKAALVQAVVDFEKGLEIHPPVAKTQDAVAARHLAMLGKELMQILKVTLTPADFQRISARLALEVETMDIEQNGLGYNNLIYMAVVLSELSLNPNTAYKALIVEEPEAHLHPQLQAILLDYLQSRERTTETVQIFVTSHSPNFASIAQIDSIECLYQSDDGIRAFFPREAKFEKTKKEKLQRYLDVTRAELFFARRILFVEGAAELFIIRTLSLKAGIDLRKMSVSLLSVDGLNFDCFLPLFAADAFKVRVAIVTDADPQGEDAYPKLNAPVVLSAAASKLSKEKTNNIELFFAQKTLEYDLALHSENRALMLDALEEIHRDIGAALRAEVNKVGDEEKPRVLFSGMFERTGNLANVQKGRYAQTLAQLMADEKALVKVPSYLEKAFEFIVRS